MGSVSCPRTFRHTAGVEDRTNDLPVPEDNIPTEQTLLLHPTFHPPEDNEGPSSLSKIS